MVVELLKEMQKAKTTATTKYRDSSPSASLRVRMTTMNLNRFERGKA
jgi:hypothetical protein